MMESSIGTSQSTESFSQSVAPSTTTESSTPVTSTPAEKVFRQSEVNDLVKKVKIGAVEDYKRLQVEQPQYASQKFGDAVQQQPQTQSQRESMPENEIRRMAAEEVQRARDQWAQEAHTKSQTEQAQRTVQNFFNKISAGKEKFADFEQVVGDINLKAFPNVVQMLGDYVDNSDEVLYELGKNRLNIAMLENLADKSPQDALLHMQRMAKSIKENAAASKTRVPNDPLSQLRPSNTGTDNGVMSVKDFRMKYKG